MAIKLLGIYPGMSRRAEMLYALQALKEFDVETIVIAGRSGGRHRTGYSPYYEDYSSLKVFRLYKNRKEMFFAPWLHYNEALSLARDFSPDIILTSQQTTARLAVNLADELEVPIVPWIESSAYEFATGKSDLKRRIPFNLLLSLAGMPPTRIAWWNWIISKSSAIITCNPQDKPYLRYLRRYGKTIHYIPWPIGLDMDYASKLRASAKKKQGIYAGSLLSAKNVQEFEKTIPQIFKETPTERFLFIGHGPEEKTVMRLHQRFGNRILHARDMPKKEVAKLIASSWYACTPTGRYGSWQFIDDCWALGTPVIKTDTGYVTHGHDGLVVPATEIVATVNRLFDEPKLYNRLVDGGLAEASERHPKRIAMKLFSVIAECVDAQR